MQVGRHAVAVFRTPNGFVAISEACPHQGVSLARGWLCQDTVACPRHLWMFSIHDGRWKGHPESPIKASVYDVKVEEDHVYVGLPPRPQAR